MLTDKTVAGEINFKPAVTFLGHLGAMETCYKHNTDIVWSYKVDMTNLFIIFTPSTYTAQHHHLILRREK